MSQKGIYIVLGLVAIFSFALVLEAQAAVGALVDPTVTVNTVYGGRLGTYTVSFQNQSSTEVETQIRVIFPSGFNISGATASSGITASATGAAIVASSTVSGQELTIWLADGSVTVASETIEISVIPNIQSPYAGGSQTFGIQTRTKANDPIDEASSTAVVFTASPNTTTETTADTIAPISLLTTPSAATTISAGEAYTIQGISNDAGGSSVQKVEVSVDGGETWLATEKDDDFSYTGSYKWKYAWSNPTEGDYTVQARATDTTGNVETPGTGVKVTVTGVAASPTPTPTPAPTPPPAADKPIAEMTVPELQAKLVQVQQQVVTLLQQLLTLLTAQL